MKKIVIIGYGYMARLIENVLISFNRRDISRIDPMLEKSESNYPDLDIFLSESIEINSNIFFICSPAKTHYYYLKRLLELKANSIFVEKPGVLTLYEYEHISQLINKIGSKVVVGYILNFSSVQSRALSELKSYYNKGYSLKEVDVVYKKKKIGTERDKYDLGVFEEFFHIADYSLNTILPETVNIKVSTTRYEVIAGRPIYMENSIETDHGCIVKILSSFKDEHKERRFSIRLHKLQSNINIDIYFDKNGNDELVISHDGIVNEFIQSLAYKKLENEMKSILSYFEGNDDIVCLFVRTRNIISLFENVQDSINRFRL